MQKDKPSIYQDRGTIGSARELDEYGVWVKSDPQILDSGGPDEDVGLSPDDLGDLPDFSTDFDDSSVDDSSASGTDDVDFLIPEEDFNLDEGDEAPDLDTAVEQDPLAELDSAEEQDLTEEPDSVVEQSSTAEPSPAEEEGGDFVDISLEDLLGEVTEQSFEEEGGEAAEEEAGRGGTGLSPAVDMSTQLLMKIAEELSSIRQELSALKQEFSSARGSLNIDRGESRGFFDGNEADDKIALTGDELNNIINTADFTEEAGADATEEEQNSPTGNEDSSSGLEALNPDLDIPDELSLSDELPSLDIDEAPLSEVSAVEAPPVELLPAEASVAEAPLMEEPLAEVPEDQLLEEEELSLVDLSNETFATDLSLPDEIPQEEAGEPGFGEFSLDNMEDLLAAGSEIILEEEAGGETPEEFGLPDISLEIQGEEEIVIGDFNEIDLSNAVIDEPDLGAEIQENPPVEPVPADVAALEDDIAAFLPGIEEPEAEEIQEEVPALEESAEAIPTAQAGASRGEDLEQIIPEGFLVEELDDEGETGFGDAGIDSLDEIPEDVLPEEDEPKLVESAGEPDIAGIPGKFKNELKQVLSYMDQLLESLPKEKIEEFAQSECFDTYKKLFTELGLV
jgi:hypothetical protein